MQIDNSYAGGILIGIDNDSGKAVTNYALNLLGDEKSYPPLTLASNPHSYKLKIGVRLRKRFCYFQESWSLSILSAGILR